MNAIQCHRARMSFELYLDGGLSLEECENLEAHLFECAACAAAVGDDVRLGEAIEESMVSGGIGALPRQPRAWSRPIRAAAAAVVLLAAGIGIGHVAAGKSGPVTAPSDSGTDLAVDASGTEGGPEALPLTELTDDPWVGLASFTNADLIDAERNALRSRGERFEWRVRRYDAALDLMRPLLEETATPSRVVDRLSDRIRQAVAGTPGRPPRENGERMREAFRHVAGAELLLRRDPHAAFGPVSRWLLSAQSPVERKAAVKLLGLLRVAEAHDLLAAEVKAAQTRDPALDGLVLLRDQRSHEVFRSILDDLAAPLDPTRITAAGGLHRLGDPRGLEFLHATFREHPGPGPNESLRRRILCHVVANPGREATAVLPELIEGVRLEPKDRGGLIELLTLSGMADTDPALLQLRSRPSAPRPF